MHSIFFLAVAILLLETSRPGWAGSGFKQVNSKELEQKYNKIFLGSFFTLDPATTRRWLKELDQQLEYDDGQEEKYDKVRKLLAFDKIDPDCDLTKRSGNELVAYYKFFTTPSATTATIRAYITNCLTRMYEQCRESFVASTKEAVDRLRRKSPDYERMVRLKELVANESDVNAPITQFLLEQVDTTCSWRRNEFDKQFEEHLSKPCKSVRDELNFMMYFDVLLTIKQIKLMGESVRQWYQVRSVCKELLLDEQGTMNGVFERLTSVIKQEDVTINKRYTRVFEESRSKPLKPEETYKQLIWLSEKLDKQSKRQARWNGWNMPGQRQLSKVKELVEMSQFWQTKQCNMTTAKEVSEYLLKKIDGLTLKRYVQHLRDQVLELCQHEMAEQVAGSAQRLAQAPQYKKIFRLRDLIAKKFDPAKSGWLVRFHDLLLGFMDEQAGAPLSPELDRAEFDKQFGTVIYQPCKSICQEFNYFGNVQNIWRMEVTNQMYPTAVRDWFMSYHACCGHALKVSDQQERTAEPIYARLIARGRRE